MLMGCTIRGLSFAPLHPLSPETSHSIPHRDQNTAEIFVGRFLAQWFDLPRAQPSRCIEVAADFVAPIGLALPARETPFEPIDGEWVVCCGANCFPKN